MGQLIKRLVIRAGDARSPIEEWQPTHYAVEGLPEGQTATLTEIKEGWIITREIGGIEEKSIRTYRTADDALEALQKEIASS